MSKEILNGIEIFAIDIRNPNWTRLAVEGIDSQSHVFNFNVEENSFDPTFMSYSSSRPGQIFTCLNWNTVLIE